MLLFAVALGAGCAGLEAPAGVQCTADVVCPAELVCIRGTCRAGAGPCGQSSECTLAEAPVCDEAARTCRACQSSVECAQRDPAAPVCAADGTCTTQSCTSDSECPDIAPRCDGMSCTACVPGAEGDGLCAMRDAALPFCTPAGSCGACADNGQCPAEAPVCGADIGECRGCREHEECASGICFAGSGECAAPADVLYVDGAEGSDGGECTSEMPCATMGAALARVTQVRRFVFVAPTVYREVLTINGKQVLLVSPGATLQPAAAQEGVPAISIGSGAAVTIQGLRVQRARGGSNGDGIRCAGPDASLRLVRSTVTENDGLGLEVSQCALSMERSVVSKNHDGGISIIDGDFSITNCFIVDNGDVAASFLGGIRIQNDGDHATQVLAFDTIARNLAQSSADASGVQCSTATPMTASSNIVYFGFGDAPAVSGSCAWVYSDVEGGAPGDGNIDEDPRFVDSVGGDYHLTEGSPCQDAGDPALGPGGALDVGNDIDRDPRSLGAAPDMGADEVD